MTMALAVALVACSAATSVKGEQGAQGAQGETGPAGPPGESSNELPMAVADKPLPMVYLAMAGSGEMKTSKADDLNDHFMDKENASLVYKFGSTNEKVAKAGLMDGSTSKMEVKAQGAGEATITVMAYDGVNTDPAMVSFDVKVVAKNIAPFGISETATDRLGAAATDLLSEEPDDASAHQKLHVLHYISEGKRTIATELDISAGTASDFEDTLIPEVVMGAAGAGDDIAVIDVVKDTAKNTWNITVEPVKSGRQNVEITMKDKFGASQMMDDPDDATMMIPVKLEFAIWINTPPSRVMGAPMPDKILVGAPFTYYYQEYFNTVEKGGTAGPGDKAAPALPTGFSGATCTPDPTIDATDAFTDTSSPAGAGVVVTPSAANVGEIVLTITCSDRDATVSDTAKITIRG